MERVLGIGGCFLRAADPAAWYREVLGWDTDEHGSWRQGAGPAVVATSDAGTTHLGDRRTVLDFRVQEMPGVGRFGWVTHPGANRVEFWQPA